MRSTEVDGFWDSSWGIFWTSFWSWRLRLCQNRDFFMADLTIWISGADFIKMGEFFALEGSMLLKLFWLKSAEIRYFSRQ